MPQASSKKIPRLHCARKLAYCPEGVHAWNDTIDLTKNLNIALVALRADSLRQSEQLRYVCQRHIHRSQHIGCVANILVVHAKLRVRMDVVLTPQ
jgi:hypothetical protein